MPTITRYYGISSPVPFIDVEVTSDNGLYLDPHAIRLNRWPRPFADEAVHCTDSFLDEVTACVISGTAADLARGERLLQRFFEPWETRFGMSARGYNGHGGAETVGTWIWDALTGDVQALVSIGALRQLEDLPLFVDGVDRDITSDITTRIVFGPLVRFTAEMVNRYPEFTASGHRMKSYETQVWDPACRTWATEKVTLPVADGKPLLLVPTDWARPNLLMSATRYYDTLVLSFAQLEQAVRGSDGRLYKTRKEDLRKQRGLEPGRDTNIEVTIRAIRSQEDLLAAFKRFVDAKFERGDNRGAA